MGNGLVKHHVYTDLEVGKLFATQLETAGQRWDSLTGGVQHHDCVLYTIISYLGKKKRHEVISRVN